MTKYGYKWKKRRWDSNPGLVGTDESNELWRLQGQWKLNVSYFYWFMTAFHRNQCPCELLHNMGPGLSSRLIVLYFHYSISFQPEDSGHFVRFRLLLFHHFRSGPLSRVWRTALRPRCSQRPRTSRILLQTMREKFHPHQCRFGHSHMEQRQVSRSPFTICRTWDSKTLLICDWHFLLIRDSFLCILDYLLLLFNPI